MATTTNYGFNIPVATDLVQQGWSQIATPIEEIDSFIAGSSASGKLFHIAGADSTSTAQTTTSSSYVNRTDCQVTFTTGKSGVFIVFFSAICSNSTTGITRASFDITGSTTVGPGSNPYVATQGTDRSGAGTVKVFDGTPNTSTTVTLAMLASAGTATVHDANIQILNLG
jgi:hypothetical protein